MDLKQFLEENPIINQTKLAEKMWPENKSSRSKLSNKLNENIAGNGKQRITAQDIEKAKDALKKLTENINEFLK